MTMTHAKEFGPKVRVNCIMCGPFHTDISKGWSRSEDYTQRAKETFPLQRAGEPEEVVGAAMFCRPGVEFHYRNDYDDLRRVIRPLSSAPFTSDSCDDTHELIVPAIFG